LLDRFLYYCLTIPVANLPLWFIYRGGDLFYFVISRIAPYRKKVVQRNLQASFPDESPAEIRRITLRFYRFFADLFAESVKNLFISEKNLRKRLVVRNPEVIEQFYDKGKNVILLSSHYNNWEFLITAQNLLFRFQAVGIGTPLSNKYWDKKINDRRERFGMKVVHANNYKQILPTLTEKPTATLVLGDQSPGKNENCYWTTFLNQETAFYFGAEFMANEFDMPVITGTIHKVRKGKYELELKLITASPRTEKYGFITESYIRDLEQTIISEPQYWLWSHKRWKKEVPKNIADIKAEHKERFVKRFRGVGVLL
jgi:Kdo2-lipid IVA lauroyltransferase/acyltransferase